MTSFGAPLQAGNRIYLLTGQWKNVLDFLDDGRTYSSQDLLVDIWSFDAATAQPVYRKRLETLRNGAMIGRSILGAHGPVLWLLLPTGVHAVSRETGEIKATPASLVNTNPSLRGLLPLEPHFFSFTLSGLSFKAADGRTWHLHPETFVATETPPAAVTAGIPPTYFTPLATHAFLERGVSLEKKWLGVLTPEEAAAIPRTNHIPDSEYQSRRSLYAADITPENTFFGPKPRYSNFQSLTQDFLAPGLLAEHRPTGHHAIIYRRNPDSVFLLHRDRLGEDGRLQLTRISGPAGKIVWNTPLPLSVLQSVMPGEERLVLFGRLYQKQDPAAPVHRDPYHEAHDMLLSVDWQSGAMKFFEGSGK